MNYTDNDGNKVDWNHEFDDVTKELVATKGFKGAGDVINGYRELETKLGTMSSIPDAASSDEDWGKFGDKLRPKDVSSYADVAPEGLPEGAFDENMAKAMKDMALEAGIPPRFFTKQWNKFWEMTGAQIKTLDEKAAEIKTNDSKALRELWKGDHDKNDALAERALTKSGVGEVLKEFGILGHPKIRDAFKNLASLTEEAITKGGDAPKAGESSWFSTYDYLDGSAA